MIYRLWFEPLIWMREHREREMARHDEDNTSTRRLIEPRIALLFFGELVHDIGVMFRGPRTQEAINSPATAPTIAPSDSNQQLASPTQPASASLAASASSGFRRGFGARSGGSRQQILQRASHGSIARGVQPVNRQQRARHLIIDATRTDQSPIRFDRKMYVKSDVRSITA